MGRLFLIRHPATQVDPNLPPEQWGLSPAGVKQLEELLSASFWSEVYHVFSSPEPKAAIVAERVGKEYEIPFSLHPELRELTRPAAVVGDYEQQAERVLSRRRDAPEGWEPLASGLDRGWRFLETVVREARLPAAIVSHGLILSAVRAKLFGRDRVDVAEWKRLPFASVATVETEGLTLIEDFATVV